jgi:hypothetical protein
MVSAVMAHLALFRLGGRSGVIGGDKPFGSRPFGEQTEEIGNVVHDLVGVVVGEVAPEARLPDLPGAGDLLPASLSYAASRRFIEDLTGGAAAPCSWPPVSESHR